MASILTNAGIKAIADNLKGIRIEAEGCTFEVTSTEDGTQLMVLEGTVRAKGWFSSAQTDGSAMVIGGDDDSRPEAHGEHCISPEPEAHGDYCFSMGVPIMDEPCTGWLHRIRNWFVRKDWE